MDLKNANVIVTGAASGLGRCFAENLVKNGASVMACDLNKEGLQALKSELSAHGTIETVEADVSNEEQVVAMVKATADAFGSVNGLINNAGIFRDAMLVSKSRKDGSIRKMSLEHWNKVIDVDLTGPFLCAREVASYMIEHDVKPGVIVSISSISRHGNMGQSNYSAAKAGLVADTRLWSKELSRYGIRTGAVAPGFTRTPILEAMRDDVLKKIVSGVPMDRLGEPYEIWQAVKFIFECDYFTGGCVDVDGGLTL